MINENVILRKSGKRSIILNYSRNIRTIHDIREEEEEEDVNGVEVLVHHLRIRGVGDDNGVEVLVAVVVAADKVGRIEKGVVDIAKWK